MATPSVTVARRTTGTIPTHQEDVTLLIRMEYDRADPFAVTFVLRAVRWTFSRELVAEALSIIGDRVAVGRADVRLRRDGATLTLVLDSPSGHIEIHHIPAADLREFLHETYAHVPLCHELDDVTWEQLMAELGLV